MDRTGPGPTKFWKSLTGPGPNWKILKSRTGPDQGQQNLENLGPSRTGRLLSIITILRHKIRILLFRILSKAWKTFVMSLKLFSACSETPFSTSVYEGNYIFVWNCMNSSNPWAKWIQLFPPPPAESPNFHIKVSNARSHDSKFDKNAVKVN